MNRITYLVYLAILLLLLSIGYIITYIDDAILFVNSLCQPENIGIMMSVITILVGIFILYIAKIKENVESENINNEKLINRLISNYQKEIEVIKKTNENQRNEEKKLHDRLLLEKGKEHMEIASKLKRELDLLTEQHKLYIDALNEKHRKELDAYYEINSSLDKLLISKSPFSDLATMYADVETHIYTKDEQYLRYKPRPAITAAEKIKEIRERCAKQLAEYCTYKYKLQFILSVFPELNPYIQDEDALRHLTDFSSLDDFQDQYDRVRDWLNDEEYNSLTIDERNQLALNRYNKRKKSNWEIGIEYELYIGYKLRQDGFIVEQFGEINGINDLGRDLVATKGNRTYIIQCKRWSGEAVVRENSICQLYGTTIDYRIKYEREHLNHHLQEIIPLFITTAQLSDTATEFANRLGVRIKNIAMGEYPMIKCNINHGQKIYHLPFDKQYHRTLIVNDGETYALTVAEATSMGFRRAFR